MSSENDSTQVEVEFTRRGPGETQAWRESPLGRVWLTLHRIDCLYDAASHEEQSACEEPTGDTGDGWARANRALDRCRRATDRVYAILRSRGIEPCGMFWDTPAADW